MRKSVFYKIYGCVLVFLFLGLIGCSKDRDKPADILQMETSLSGETALAGEAALTEEMASAEGTVPAGEVTLAKETTPAGEELTGDISQKRMEMPSNEGKKVIAEPIIDDMDWSAYFDGINGTAVIYEPAGDRYQIYNQELALTRRSPCSTFKIISSLIALENGIVNPNESVRTWSGEVFWNEEWNRDIDFPDAFRSSCVWYFREVIDEIGKDMMQESLNELGYGNCDISDWEGRLNTNNNNPVLTGFWIESSLLISPREQAEVMERIFGDSTVYSEETQNQLKQVMLVQEQQNPDIFIYGKTGMGKAYGIVIDSWYTGFADVRDKRIYFCVYLGETDRKNVSSAKAKEIAIKIVSDSLSRIL